MSLEFFVILGKLLGCFFCSAIACAFFITLNWSNLKSLCLDILVVLITGTIVFLLISKTGTEKEMVFLSMTAIGGALVSALIPT